MAVIIVVAAPGDLDPSFGNGGKVITSFSNSVGGRHSRAYAMAIQSDGKIVVAGERTLVRYNKDGSLDTLFGLGGKVTTPTDTSFNAVAIQSDGKIVIAGWIIAGNADFALIRYNTDGSLDTSFGTNGGIVVTTISGSADIAHAVAILSDGRIIAAGASGPYPSVDFAVVRYNPDGSLDSTFGTGGKVVTDISGLPNIAYSMAIQADGKVVAAGYSGLSDRDFALVRYNTDGTLDNSFGTGGRVTTSIGSKEDRAYAVAVQSDGRVVAAGFTFSGSSNDFALTRYNTDGSLDSSFGTGGKVITPVGSSSSIYAVAIQSNGKIVAVGGSGFALARYNTNGSLDSSFGSGGKVTTLIGNGISEARAVAIQPDGKIVAAGTITYIQGGDGISGSDFALARYLGDPAISLNTPFDFDGDGKADISVFRPSNGYWYIMKSSGGYSSIQWGLATDRLVPGDYDGDGKTDLAVYRGGIFGTSFNNTWYILRSSDNTSRARQWGISGGFIFDSPVPADYDGDGKTDLAFYRNSDAIPTPGDFHILQSSTDSGVIKQWGTNADRRVPTDYDGDGKADLAVFRTNNFPGSTEVNTWFILQSSNGAMRVERFGLPTDRLVPADYDGDGKADIAVWRPSNGFWYRLNSSDGSFYAEQFGTVEDRSVPADYDGDGKTDIAVFRPSNGTWYLQRSTEGFAAQQFGLSTDIPIPSVYVR
jgi:uncharacterized delta-60 repeat protein